MILTPSRSWLDLTAQVAAAVTCAACFAVAAHGVVTWEVQPTFPPPAANASLLLLRQAITIVLAAGGLALLPFAAGARGLRTAGAGAAVLAGIGHAFAAQAYRDLTWAPVLSAAALGCAITGLALVAAAPAPRVRR